MLYDYFKASGYITFKVLPAINVQFGQSTNFIGHGKRSLLLSDFATDYLFLKINTQVWKFNYQNLYAKLIDRYGEIVKPWPAKYMTAHYLGIDLFRNFNVGFYETVIFHDNRNTGRGYDLYYLNPIIFYRSVEHLLGDADKVMVGFNTSYTPFKTLKLYGQLMVNEFRFNDLIASQGNANNKFGYQLGLKYINVATINNLDLEIEYNHVRPYSYTHYTMPNETHPVNSYSHFNQPLAHPLGANFSELLLTINAQPLPRLNLELNLITTKIGMDYYPIDSIYQTNNLTGSTTGNGTNTGNGTTTGNSTTTGNYTNVDPSTYTPITNWGQNIFLDYRTYENELNNRPGQGIHTQITILEAIATYHIKHNLFLDLEFKYRHLNSELKHRDNKNYYIGTALRLNLERRRWEY